MKGRYGFDYAHHPHRLAKPLIRKPGVEKSAKFKVDPGDWSEVFREASWDEALDAAARGDKRARVKTFRRQECMKDGKDRFDESVNEFLQKVGGDNIIAIHPITYSYPAKEGNQMLTDYGVIVHYKA